jgi:hypothetical protein
LFYSRVGVVGANGRDGVESLVFFVFRAGGGGDVRRGGAGHEEHVILVGSRAASRLGVVGVGRSRRCWPMDTCGERELPACLPSPVRRRGCGAAPFRLVDHRLAASSCYSRCAKTWFRAFLFFFFCFRNQSGERDCVSFFI